MPASTALFTLQGDALPADAAATRFEAQEALSEPYSVVIELSTEDSTFRVDDCLRTHVRLVVVGASGESRVFDGVVDRARFVRIVAEQRQFEIRLRPALAALAHREGCRIFQEKTIVQVAQTYFEEAGFGDRVVWNIAQTYEPREFIVQYNESHLAFVSRLLEENGIFYFFRHGPEGHTMVLGDSPSALAGDGGPTPLLGLAQGIFLPGAQPLKRFSRSRALRTSFVHLRDFDFEKPAFPPEAKLPAKEVVPMPYFEYPGGFTKGQVGARLANARLRELRRDADTCEGASGAIGLAVGAPFVVEGAAEPGLDGEYVITHLTTHGNQTFSGGERNVALENELKGIPKGAPYAPPRRTPKPKIMGVQTAIVTGSSDQEQAIHVDKYGRIKVRFYWDRLGQQDHSSSLWIRMAQVGLGGSMSLPRVGWEVAIAFLDGDPDRPVALGRVYNAEKTAPYGLPAQKTTGALKSMSSPGAGGYNEIKMGDSAGGQGLDIHAQKDLNVTIKNNKTETIGVDEERSLAVNGSRTVMVNETITVGSNQTLDVGDVRSQHIGANQDITIGGNDTTNATANYVEKIDGCRSYSVGGTWLTISNGIEQQFTGDFTRDVGSMEIIGSIASIQDNVIASLDENVGAFKVQLVNGSHGETIAADKHETYMVGELHLTPAGMKASADGSVTNLVGGLHYRNVGGDFKVTSPIITMLGVQGSFNGGGSELVLSGANVELKAPKIAVDATLVVKMSGSMKLGS